MCMQKSERKHNGDKLVSILTSASKGATDEDVEEKLAVEMPKN